MNLQVLLGMLTNLASKRFACLIAWGAFAYYGKPDQITLIVSAVVAIAAIASFTFKPESAGDKTDANQPPTA